MTEEITITQDGLNNERGKVVANFAYLENFISGFIASAYFKDDEPEQLEAMKAEILDDKMFSFEFKKQVLSKILKARFSDIDKAFPYKKLEQMQTARNTIAHGILIGRGEAGSKDVTNICFKHGGKSHRAEELLKKYEKLRAEVQPFIVSLPGIIITPH